MAVVNAGYQSYRGLRIPRLEGWEVADGPYRGNYGSVVIYRNVVSPTRKTAVKVLNSYLSPDLAIAEAEKQRAVGNRSTYVVRITDVQRRRGRVPAYIQMEFYPDKLDAYLQGSFTNGSGGLDYSRAAPLLWGICQGINDAHDLPEADKGPIVHGDIKAANVLLDENLVPKIADFGAARSLTKDYPLVRGSANWMAPELLDDTHADYTTQPTKECDYFSYGVLAYVMLTARHPFHHSHPSCLWSAEDNIRNASFNPVCLASSLTDARPRVCDQIMLLLSRDPRDRVQAFKNLKILLSSDALPGLSEMPKVPPETPRLPLGARYDLEPGTLGLLHERYEKARELFFVDYQPREAVAVLDGLLDDLRWEDLRGTRLEPLADCWSFRSYINNSAGLYLEAVESASKGLSIHPAHVNSLFTRGYAYAQMGDDEEALTDLQTALELTTDAVKQVQIRRLLNTVRNRLQYQSR